MTTQLAVLPWIGPYPPGPWSGTEPWRRSGAQVVIGFAGQRGGVQVETEAEYTTTINKDQARARVYFTAVGA